MRAGAATVHELSGGRMLLGLGSSHRDTVSEVRGHEYGGPLTVMRDYLAAYEAAPYRGPEPHGRPPLVLAALRPRMLALAATATDGAFPYLVPESYVAGARARLDEAAAAAGRPRPLLVVSLPVLRETDATAARAAARRYLDRYLGLPNYLNSLREAGFGDEELAKPGSDRLVDALVAWGDDDTLRSRLRAMLDAGADQVAMIPLTPEGLHADRATMEALARPPGRSVFEDERHQDVGLELDIAIAPDDDALLLDPGAAHLAERLACAVDSLTNRVLEGIGRGAAQLGDACDGHGRVSSIRWADQYGPMGGLFRLHARRPRPAAHRPPMR